MLSSGPLYDNDPASIKSFQFLRSSVMDGSDDFLWGVKNSFASATEWQSDMYSRFRWKGKYPRKQRASSEKGSSEPEPYAMANTETPAIKQQYQSGDARRDVHRILNRQSDARCSSLSITSCSYCSPAYARKKGSRHRVHGDGPWDEWDPLSW